MTKDWGGGEETGVLAHDGYCTADITQYCINSLQFFIYLFFCLANKVIRFNVALHIYFILSLKYILLILLRILITVTLLLLPNSSQTHPHLATPSKLFFKKFQRFRV